WRGVGGQDGEAEFAGVAIGRRDGRSEILPGVIGDVVGQRKTGIARTIGGHGHAADIKLAFAITGVVRAGVAININKKNLIGGAVDFSCNHGRGGKAVGVGDDGEILQIVRAREKTGMVQRDAVAVEINAEIVVAENGIAANGIIRGARVV